MNGSCKEFLGYVMCVGTVCQCLVAKPCLDLSAVALHRLLNMKFTVQTKSTHSSITVVSNIQTMSYIKWCLVFR